MWTSDITYLWTEESWLHLAIVLDLFNREVVGWSLKPRTTSDIVTDALTMAWFRRRPAPGLLHHSDRGSQYASHAFQSKMKATSFEYIEVFYNRKRQHSTLGYKSPTHFLANWLSEQQQEILVA